MMHHADANGEGSAGPILVAMNLRKSYGQRLALKSLTFSLAPGRILGFLGPNGAGKTTAIRILTTMMEPDGGTFTVDGVDAGNPDEIRRRIGVLPESLGFHKHMTGLESLTFFGRLYGRTPSQARDRGRALLREVGLEQRATSMVGAYSRGMRQRLGIARTLVNDPSVVFLDEPTLGLDPRGQQELLELITTVARGRRVGVVLCSHALPEVESVCDDVVILNQGTVVASGTVSEVIGRTQLHAMQRNSIRIQVPSEAMAAAQTVLSALPMVAAAAPIGETAGWLRIEVADAAEARSVNNQLLEALIRADIPVLNFETAGGRLQEVFLHLTEEVAR